MRLLNEKGGAALGFIIFASISAAFLASNLNIVLDTLGSRKKSFRVNSELDSYVRGVVTYSKYALKERWCMNDYWERSDDCGSNMDEIVSNPLNLERLLWSNAAINDIKVLYEGVYGEVMSFNPSLSKIELTVSAENLKSC